MSIHVTIYGAGANRLLPRQRHFVIEDPAEHRRRQAQEDAASARDCDRRGGIWGVSPISDRIGP